MEKIKNYINLETQEIYYDQVDGALEIDMELLKELMQRKKHAKDKIILENNEFKVKSYELTKQEQQQIEKDKLINELYEIDTWLKDNDWIVNKIILHEWTEDDLRFIEYKTNREIKRTRRDEIINILGE